MKQTCLYRPGIGGAPDCGLRDDYEKVCALAYLGEHRFPDLTWKARCEELLQENRTLQQALQRYRERLDRENEQRASGEDCCEMCGSPLERD